MHIITSDHEKVSVKADYEEIDTCEQNAMCPSVQHSRSNAQVKPAAILQQMPFKKQHKTVLETFIQGE